MKLFSKLAAVLFVCAFLFASCNKTTCYNCVGFDDGTTSLEDLGTICEGDSTSATKEELDAAVALYEAFGGTCTKE